jgi:hypothetical protein
LSYKRTGQATVSGGFTLSQTLSHPLILKHLLARSDLSKTTTFFL